LERARHPWNFPYDVSMSPNWNNGGGFNHLEIDESTFPDTYLQVRVLAIN
jgi:hypothetical protein